MYRSTLRAQRRLRVVQTVGLVGALLFITVRAVGTLLGTGAAWLSVAFIGAAALYSVQQQRVLLPRGSRQVEPWEAPQLFEILSDLSRSARLRTVPELYLVPSHVANAVTTGSAGRSIVVITSELARRLSLRELRAVLAHEIAHIRNNDLLLFALSSAFQQLTVVISRVVLFGMVLFLPLLMIGGVYVPAGLILFMAAVPLVALLLQFAVLRTREFQADLTAAELTGDPAALASALQRLEQPVYGWFDWLVSGRATRRGDAGGFSELLRSHPPTSERLERLRALARD